MGTRLAVVVCLLTLAGAAACGDNRDAEPDAGCTPVDDGNDCTADLCVDGQPVNQARNPGESCAAGVCDGAGACVACLEDDDCEGTDVCDEASNACVPPTCTDGEQNGDETDVDCGGSCAPSRLCADGAGCAEGPDCTSGVCGAGGTCSAPACGDGVRQGSEACDDGNQTNGDGCDDGTGGTCRPTGCGNGTRAGTEICDDGNNVNGDGCDNNCTATACGNGVISTGETCDDADTMGGDGCSATCAIETGFTCTMVPSVCVATCGDGMVAATEACDDAPPAESGDGCSITCTVEPGFGCTGSPSVCTSVCGDGIRAPNEGCDDADTMGMDGCNAMCFVEPGWVCVGTPSTCFPICGDSRVVPTEPCDDPAPAENGDGCSATCRVETGYACTGSPSTCAPVCGDGLRLGMEPCDDAPPAESGDGCSATCTIESGWTCTGSPSTCVTTCGDGIRAGAEACDDDDTDAGDGCSATCTVETGWTCTGAPLSTCTPICGDGLVRTGEACDDAPPAESGDGCSDTCTVELGYNCQGEPSVCLLTCGNGVLDTGEGCDDDGNVDGDGCTAACTVESGWTCTGAPSSCVTTCGDGIIAGTEACDDAPPAENGDGCSATCTIESGWTCTGAPSTCVTRCGDGITAGTETCDDGCNAGMAGVCEPADNLDGCSQSCQLECGNGVLNVALEQCDDGNRASGDRCSSACAVEIGCAADETAVIVANNTPLAIPDTNTTGVLSPASVLATGAVSRAIVFISSLTHTQDDNLDIYLVSPTGVTRELSTDNGSTGDNYLQTYFDDTAGSASNTSGVVAPFTGRFRPEQSLTLAAGTDFLGQRAGGTWNLRVADDGTATATGALDAWVLGLCVRTQAFCGDGNVNPGEDCDDGNVIDNDGCNNACAIADGCGDGNLDAGEACDDNNIISGDGCSDICQHDITCPTGHTPLIVTSTAVTPIPNNDPTGINSTVSVIATGGVSKATVLVSSITHTNVTDIDMFLVSPTGVRRELSTDNGSTGDHYRGALFDDAAPAVIPSALAAAPFTGRHRGEQSLSVALGTDLLGTSAAGTWTLNVADDADSTASGTLDAWSLALCIDPAARCGDGVRNGPEECDDGNGVDTDACTNLCGVTDGCGDNNLDAGEACDDGNTASGDGCSAACVLDIACGPGETQVIATSTDPITMPDSDTGGAIGTINVTTAGLVRRAIITVDMNHTSVGQTTLRVAPPFGPERDLSSGNGGTGDNMRSVTFSDSALAPITSIAATGAPYTGTYLPEESISTTAGYGNQGAGGLWSLRAFDSSTGETGAVTRWTLQLCVDTSAISVCGNGVVEANESCDDQNFAGGDGCASCRLELNCPIGQTAVITRSTDGARVFRDNDVVGTTMAINVTGVTGVVRKIMPVVNTISSIFNGDVVVTLQPPGGGNIELSSNNGSGGDFYLSAIFDDASPTPVTQVSTSLPIRGWFKPEQALTPALGMPASGIWTMKVHDNAGGIAGAFGGWTLGMCVQ